MDQTISVLSEKAMTYAKTELPRRVRFLLEEVGNIPPIEGLSKSLNVGLGRGLIYHLVIQSYPQLDQLYGEKMAKAITGACGNTIYIMSDEYADADHFSKKLGEKSIIVLDRSGSDMLSTERNYSEREESRPLLNANELRSLRKGEWVVDRTKKREDLDKNRIVAHPIFCNIEEGTYMTHRYEYLLHRFDNPSLEIK